MTRTWRDEGATLKDCCERLNAMGHYTFRGRPWTPGRLSQVMVPGLVADYHIRNHSAKFGGEDDDNQ